jgi:hypothetical protein
MIRIASTVLLFLANHMGDNPERKFYHRTKRLAPLLAVFNSHTSPKNPASYPSGRTMH